MSSTGSAGKSSTRSSEMTALKKSRHRLPCDFSFARHIAIDDDTGRAGLRQRGERLPQHVFGCMLNDVSVRPARSRPARDAQCDTAHCRIGITKPSPFLRVSAAWLRLRPGAPGTAGATRFPGRVSWDRAA